MNNLFKKNALVFDIGAHYGESAKLFVEAGALNVIAVEPNINSFLKLREQAALLAGVVPLCCAIEHEPGVTSLWENKRNDGCSTTVPALWGSVYPGDVFADAGVVPALTLDDLMARFGVPQYVKVDVEGNEYRVLKGMSFRPDCLTFEFHKHPQEGHIETARVVTLLRERHFYTKCCITDDTLLAAEPNMELADLLNTTLPGWGNITVW